MKYLFAVNPISGKNKAKEKMKRLALLLRKNNINYLIYETKPYHYAEDLRNIILANNITHVFAVGGDGTAHEVLNSVVGLDVYFGIIPFGSGNDFARVMELPRKIPKIIKMIKANEFIEIDVGKVNERYFINYISFGFDVAVLKKSFSLKKFFRSGLSYLLALIITLITYKCKNYLINDKKQKLYLATIHNGKYYGGGMKINPFAEVNDGLLDLCTVKKISRLKFFVLFPLVFFGKHFKLRKIVNFESRRIYKLVTDEKMVTCGMDGELYEFSNPIEITIIPKCVKMIRYKYF